MRSIIILLLAASFATAGTPDRAAWKKAWYRARQGGGAVAWTPADLGGDLVMWLSSAATNNMEIDSDIYGDIVSWTNSAPSYPSSYFTANSAFRKPELSNGYINGYPAVYTITEGATDAYGTWSGTNDLNAASGASSFAVLKLIAMPTTISTLVGYSLGTSAAGARCLISLSTSQRFRLDVRRDDADGTASTTYSPTGQSSITTNDWLMWSTTVDLSDKQSYVYANGQTVSTNTLTTSTGDSFSATDSVRAEVFTTSQSQNNNLPAYYTDIITVNRALTQAEVQKLEGWSAHRYALTDLLPSDHPYKNTAPTK